MSALRTLELKDTLTLGRRIKYGRRTNGYGRANASQSQVSFGVKDTFVLVGHDLEPEGKRKAGKV